MHNFFNFTHCTHTIEKIIQWYERSIPDDISLYRNSCSTFNLLFNITEKTNIHFHCTYDIKHFFQEEVQKLAAQIEFMKIVHMEINNRHVKPKTSSYFNSLNAPTVVHSPLTKQGCILGGSQSKPPEELWHLKEKGGEWLRVSCKEKKNDPQSPVEV